MMHATQLFKMVSWQRSGCVDRTGGVDAQQAALLVLALVIDRAINGKPM
jgi:hypothetical protein